MSEGIYFTSTGDISHEFHYSDTDNGNITYYVLDNGTGLSLKFKSSSCFNKFPIRIIDLDLPIFNTYYDSEECDTVRRKGLNVDVCQQLISKKLIRKSSDFYDSINQYLSVDTDGETSIFDKVKFLFSNIYVLIGGIVVTVVLVVFIVFLVLKHVRRSRLD